MSDLVPADKIEALVGARRHAKAHLGRAVSADRQVYVLHSAECKNSGIDLRTCIYSQALDQGIDTVAWRDWKDVQDQVVTLQVLHGWLHPDPDGPNDVDLLEDGT